jgi:hypothetical protein
MQVGAQINTSLPKDQVRPARLLVHAQAYDCICVCYFFVCNIECVDLDQQCVDSYH